MRHARSTWIKLAVVVAGIVPAITWGQAGSHETSCSVAGLSRPGACAGPWAFHSFVQPCWSSRADAACGAAIGFEKKAEPVFPVCRAAGNGVESFFDKSYTYSIAGQRTDVERCQKPRPRPVPAGCRPPRVCDPEPPAPPECTIEHTCSLGACDGKDMFDNAVPPALRSGASYRDILIAEDRGRCETRCQIDMFHVPQFVLAENAACGPARGTRQVDDPARPLYPACRHPSHGAAPLGDCGLAQEVQYSAFGLTLEELLAGNPSIVAAPRSPAPQCTTCDDLALAAAQDAPAMLQCLQTQAAVADRLPVDRARLGTVLVEKEKLLYELYGDALPAAARHDLELLYTTRPDATPACASSFVVPEAPATCLTGRASYDRVRFCSRLLLGHVPPAVVVASLDTCLGAAADLARLPGTCAPDVLSASGIKVSAALIQRLLGSVDGEGTPPLPAVTSLREKLALIERWHQAVRPLAEASADRHADMLDAMQQLVATLWDAARTAGAQAPGATRDQIAATAIEIDRRMLLAAVGGDTAAVTGAPLLHVVGRGMELLAVRVRGVTLMSDLGCLLGGCGAGGTTSEVSELWALWAQLGNPDGMNAALAAASNVRPAWRAVFEALGRRGAQLQEAIAAGARGNHVIDLATADAAELFPYATPVSVLVREAAARSTSFARFGRLELHPRSVLRGGLASAQIAVIESELAARIATLRSTATTFTQNERSYLTDLQNELATGGQQIAAKTQLVDRRTQLLALADDLAGLRESAAMEANEFAGFVGTFVDVAKQESQTPIRTAQQSIAIAASDATYPGHASGIADVAVRRDGKPWSHRVARGSMVALRTTGQWSPTCALRATTLADPTGDRQAPIDVGDALTGPEGYLVQWQAGSYHATTNRTSTEVSDHRALSSTGKACAGARAALKPPGFVEMFSPLDLEVYVSVDACMSSDQGHSEAATLGQDASTGLESRQTAAFATGLRAPGTPAPTLPAGSLLVVRLPAGATELSRAAVSVVRTPLTELIIDGDSDLYFVVNDRTGCSTAGALTVELTDQVMVGAMAEATAGAMADALAMVSKDSPRVLDQGRILPGELAVMRETAYQMLRQRVPSVDSLPPVLRGLFDRWLDAELLKIQREVEIQGIQRSMTLLRNESAAAAEQLRLLGGAERLATELTRASVINLDADRLAGDVGRLTSYLTEYLHPALALRYPAVLAQMTQDRQVLDRFAALRGLDFMRPVPELANDVLAVADLMKQQWDATRLDAVASANVGTSVALSFPRPDAATTSVWARADPARSRSVWNALDDPHQRRVALEIRPEDLYSAHGGASRLQCTEATPVIRSMAIVLGVGSAAVAESLNGQNWRVPAQVDGDLRFTTAVGPLDYLLSNGDWLTETMGVLFSVPGSAVPTFDRLGRSALVGNGLSPFTRYTIDADALRSTQQLADATELIVVFELERQRVAAPGIRGVPLCRPATSSAPLDRTPLGHSKTLRPRAPLKVLPGVKRRARRW